MIVGTQTPIIFLKKTLKLSSYKDFRSNSIVQDKSIIIKVHYEISGQLCKDDEFNLIFQPGYRGQRQHPKLTPSEHFYSLFISGGRTRLKYSAKHPQIATICTLEKLQSDEKTMSTSNKYNQNFQKFHRSQQNCTQHKQLHRLAFESRIIWANAVPATYIYQLKQTQPCILKSGKPIHINTWKAPIAARNPISTNTWIEIHIIRGNPA